MPDRKNLKISPDVYERLKETKGESGTWNGFLHHLLDAYHDPRPRIPSKGGTIGELAERDHEKLAERANELVEEVDFAPLLEANESGFAGLIAELMAQRVVEELEAQSHD